jgi:hypothetical protein
VKVWVLWTIETFERRSIGSLARGFVVKWVLG